MKKTPFRGNDTSLKINNRKKVSHSESKEFERCVDFMARMIEKYGSEIELPKTNEREKEKIDAPKQPIVQSLCTSA